MCQTEEWNKLDDHLMLTKSLRETLLFCHRHYLPNIIDKTFDAEKYFLTLDPGIIYVGFKI